jgi:hypothetical protein
MWALQSSSSPIQSTIIYSPGSLFTGGTTTTNPSATDGITLLNTANWISTVAFAARKVHVWTSSIGFIVLIYSVGNCQAAWNIEKINSMSPGWTSGPIARIKGTATPMGETLISTADWFAKHSTILTAVCLDVVRSNTTSLASDTRWNATNQIDTGAGYPSPKIVAFSTAGTIGTLGVARDMKYGMHAGLAEADEDPSATFSSTPKRWVRVGGAGIWYPGDCTTTLLTT